MKVLYGTGNPAKLSAMKRRLESLDMEIIGLKDLDMEIPNVPEDGLTPLENARQKASAYYELFHIPVFSCCSFTCAQVLSKFSGSFTCMQVLSKFGGYLLACKCYQNI